MWTWKKREWMFTVPATVRLCDVCVCVWGGDPLSLLRHGWDMVTNSGDAICIHRRHHDYIILISLL